MSTDPVPLMPELDNVVSAKKSSSALQVVGWFSMGMVVAVLSVYLGVELRSRYRFKKRTPYDFYSNAGEKPVSEFGVGI